jgi:hypothetical protein
MNSRSLSADRTKSSAPMQGVCARDCTSLQAFVWNPTSQHVFSQGSVLWRRRDLRVEPGICGGGKKPCSSSWAISSSTRSRTRFLDQTAAHVRTIPRGSRCRPHGASSSHAYPCRRASCLRASHVPLCIPFSGVSIEAVMCMWPRPGPFSTHFWNVGPHPGLCTSVHVLSAKYLF